MVTDTKATEGASSTEIVEQRVKPTVIRRRRMQVESPKEEPMPVGGDEPPQGAAATSETAPLETTLAEKNVQGEPSSDLSKGKKPPIVQKEEKRLPLRIIAQPDDVRAKAGEGAETGKVDADHTEKLEKEIEKIAKKTKKKKSRAELQFEDIQKHGGLKQFVREIDGEEVVPPVVASTSGDEVVTVPEVSRVFRPTARLKKKKPGKKAYQKTIVTEKKAIKKIIRVAAGITVSELSQLMGIKASEIIKKLISLGMMATVNQAIEPDMAAVIATEYGYEVENTAFKEEKYINVVKRETSAKDQTFRPPVVTVMGHVDHGKTSVLDVIRQSNVASGEAGGITQHIGAYTVKHNDKTITFIDTPGHEAFTHMRARGALVTDIVILVVAADDGVMPQTKEAIDHAKAAGVPIVVAINKIDKPNANLDKVKRELSESGLLPEDWGGEVICVPTSAKLKTGIDQLLEMILLQSEMLELKASYQDMASGIVIESKMDKRRGPIVTCIIKNGTLKRGDAIVSGTAWGNARLMLNDKGEPVEEVTPSQPVSILGLNEVPEAGEQLAVVEDEKAAKAVSENRMLKTREETLLRRSKVTLEDFKTKLEGGEVKELNIIVKTDVKGVADAIRDSLPGLSTSEVRLKVVHTGVGGITEGDILLAAASNAVVLGFNVVADTQSRQLAEREGVEIKTYSIIYEMLDDIKKAIVGMLKPKEVEKILGRAEVRQTFKVPKIGVIAGCFVTSGKILRSARVRLLRDNVIVHDGKISSLRRFKDDAREVVNNMECGIGIENYQDIKIGDEFEAYIIEEIAATWESSSTSGSKT